MFSRIHLTSAVWARRLLFALGGLYIVLPTVWLRFRSLETTSLAGELIVFFLIAGPGVILLYGGYRLPQYEIREEFSAVLVEWCLGGLGVMLGVLALFHFRPGGELSNPIQSILILTALGTLAGFAVGVQDARAKTRTREVELRNQELRRTKEQLENTVEQLEASNERIEEFVSIISHDLRNPLNVAQGRLELASEGRDDENLRQIASAHERMKTMIEDLLTHAQTDEHSLALEPVHLESIARSCWQHVSTKRATLTVETDRTILSDEDQLRHLLENLVRNAVEHGGEDVTMTIGELEGGFYVEDDGTGIPEADREAVFDTGYSKSSTGIGIGLAIVKQVVEAHDWTVSVDEGTDGGARFEISGVEIVE